MIFFLLKIPYNIMGHSGRKNLFLPLTVTLNAPIESIKIVEQYYYY